MKFQSFLKYFDWLETHVATQETTPPTTTTINDAKQCTQAPGNDAGVHVSRKVFSGKQWLTIEDWLECTLPLCPLEIRHESRIERTHDDIVHTVFASSRIGGDFLSDGWSQVWENTSILISFESDTNHYTFSSFLLFKECLEFTILPELIATLLYVEALEDNEVIFVENLRQINRVMTDSSKTPFLESLQQPKKVSVCLMDAENYSTYPDSQFEEDNVLRELNKCLLAFRQNTTSSIITSAGTTNMSRISSMSSSLESSNELTTQKDREPKR